MTVLLAAVAIDVLFGEPPSALHPVVWMGRVINLLIRRAPLRGVAAFVWGFVVAVVVPALFAGLTWWALASTTGIWRWCLAVYLLKSTFASRALARAAMTVRRPLGRGDLIAARGALRGLVSRDTGTLPPPAIAAAAIESVAENASDSIVAPLFFYAIGGVPAAVAYRAVNTLDAMIGYRGRFEWLGKASARLDDVANLIPARLTAWLIIVTCPLAGGSFQRAFAIWRRDGRRTESPNAGHPMAAAAGALGIELEKIGCYRLGAGMRPPELEDIDRVIVLLAVVTAAAVALCAWSGVAWSGVAWSACIAGAICVASAACTFRSGGAT